MDISPSIVMDIFWIVIQRIVITIQRILNHNDSLDTYHLMIYSSSGC